MRASGVVRSFTAAASTLLLGLVAVPVTASPGVVTHLHMMEAATSATSAGDVSDQGTRSFAQAEDADQTCLTDLEGDEQKDFNSPQPADEPRVDIVEHCVGYGPTLALSVRVAQPTDPLTDPNWQRGTFVGWFLDTDGDGEGDFFVDFSLEAGEDEPTLGASVQRLVAGEESETTCSQELVPSSTGWYSVSNIAPECFDGAQTVRVQVGTFYEDEAGDDNFDTAPEGDQFTEPVETSGERATRRLEGKERIATSVAISNEQFPNGAQHVYLARQDLFADAVSAGSLTRGPIILVPSCGDVPQIVTDEIDRLSPDAVYALGGTNAICDQVLADAADGRNADRIFGTGRIETSVAVSQFQFSNPGTVHTVYLARADVFADAVAGGVLTGGPILLVPSCDGVPTEVQQEIERLDPDSVIALGGTSAICKSTLDAAAFGRGEERLSGPTRIQTAIAISQHEFPRAAPTVYLARAFPDDKLADSVAGGSLTGGPVLLVPECGELPAEVAGEISRLAPTEVIALGGSGAVCDEILTQAGQA